METANLQIPSEILSNLSVPQIVNIMDKLPINPKYTWTQLAGVRNINDLTYIGIHHDAWPKKNRAGVDDVKFAAEIAQDHIEYVGNEEDGDAGFPYHFWIRNGLVYQCNDVLDRTYGIGGHNGYIVHVCVSGDYHNYDTLTDADRNALYAILIALKQQLPNYKGMVGHCELNPKDCPGFDHNQVKKDVLAKELAIKSANSTEQQRQKMYTATEQHRYLFNQYSADPANNKWLEEYLLKMWEVTKEYGMFFDK